MTQQEDHEDRAVCDACGWEGMESDTDCRICAVCPECKQDQVNFFFDPEN